MAHLNVVKIRPFSDSNGRMARFLQTLVLAVERLVRPELLSIEECLGENTRKYYSVLLDVGGGAWNPCSDPLPWIRFILTAHYRQAATNLSQMEVVAKLWDELELEIGKRKLPERVVHALSDAAMGHHVCVSQYMKTGGLTRISASRDLKDLVRIGFLIQATRGRPQLYVASPSLKDIWVKIRDGETKQIADPFECKVALSEAPHQGWRMSPVS